jgi:hypothetical protein
MDAVARAAAFARSIATLRMASARRCVLSAAWYASAARNRRSDPRLLLSGWYREEEDDDVPSIAPPLVVVVAACRIDGADVPGEEGGGRATNGDDGVRWAMSIASATGSTGDA